MTIVTIEHARSLGYCVPKIRSYFKEKGLDFADFLDKGIDADKLLSVDPDNQLIIDVIKVANGQRI